MIGGPTGSGKNRLAMELALRFSGEIVNADSRQIYRGLVIGTNYPSQEEMNSVPHHLYGFLHPALRFSAAEYERAAASVIEGILRSQKLPVVVGGTGFYMKALLKGTWEVPGRDPVLRGRLESLTTRRGKEFAHRLLARLDPDSANQIPINDTYRVIRALEILLRTGKKRSQLVVNRTERFKAARFYLDVGRDLLNEVILGRTEQMFQNGWVEEVQGLLQEYPGFEGMPAGASLGYQEIIQFIRGECSLSECKEWVVRKTMQYAKRQLTWFRNQDQFVRLNSQQGLHKIIDSVLQLQSDIVEFLSSSKPE